MAKRKKRIRSPHPGVKLKRRTLPSGAVAWRAHFVDPDTDREVAITLDPDALSTKEAREQWAKTKSADLARKRMERAAGVRPAETSEIEDALKTYTDTAKSVLRAKTLDGHELAFAKLREWAKRDGVRSTADLTPAKLALLRDFIVTAPRQGVQKGARRGARLPSSARRAPRTVNRELASLKTLFNVWRKRGMLPSLHRDDIADALEALPVPREEPDFLPPASLKALFAAALRHDAECFAETREEHIGRRRKGTTPRHVPIAAFVAFVLLTGLRRSEALAVPWSIVDLEALDHEGRTAGEIRLPPSITKTKRARTIGLEVSPALRRVLAAMRLQRASGPVFSINGEPYTSDLIETARRRMISEYGAPSFSWQALRSTCATYLTNAPGIFGSATVFLSAKQLGHAVAVAEKHYLGTLRGIPRDARTLEAAMQIEREMADLLGAAVTRAADRRLAAAPERRGESVA